MTASSNRILSGEQFSGWQRWHPGALAIDPSPQRRADSAKPAESAESIRKKALAAGFEEGKRTGFATGLAEGRAQAKAEAAHLRAVAQAAEAALQALGDTLAEKTVHLAAAIANKVLLRELQTRPEHLVDVVRDALNLLPDGAERVRLLVNTDDVALIRQFIEDGGHPDITVVGTNDVPRGGCRLQSAAGDVDATLATRLARVMEVLGQTEITADDN